MNDKIEIITVYPYTILAALGAIGVLLVLSIVVIALLLRRHRRLVREDSEALLAGVWSTAQYIAELREPAAFAPFDRRLQAMIAPRSGDRAKGATLSLTIIVTEEKTTVRVRDGRETRAETTDPHPSKALARVEDMLGIVRAAVP